MNDNELYDYEAIDYEVTFTVRGKKCYPISTYQEILKDPSIIDEDIKDHAINHWDSAEVSYEVTLL